MGRQPDLNNVHRQKTTNMKCRQNFITSTASQIPFLNVPSTKFKDDGHKTSFRLVQILTS